MIIVSGFEMENRNRDRKFERQQDSKKIDKKNKRQNNTVPEDILEDEMFLLKLNLARQQGYEICRCGTAREITVKTCPNCD